MTSAPFLDTNVILRHLAKDEPVQATNCLALMRELETGSTVVWTTHLVVAEAVFTLARFYQLNRQEIADRLLPILEFPGIKLPQKRLFRRVFDLYTITTLSFVDCYHGALVEAQPRAELLSYDQGFDRLPSLRRVEP